MPITTSLLDAALGQRLARETLDQLSAAAAKRAYLAGAVLCREGDPGDAFFVILEGRVIISQRLEKGAERRLEELGPGEYFGEMALIDDQPRMATVTAVTPVTLLEITGQLFDRLVEESPALANLLMRRILTNMRRNDRMAIAELEAKNRELQQAYRDLQAAQARLVEKERLQRELELAAEVQRRLLPAELPHSDGYRFAAYLEPARAVGGDFYDVVASGPPGAEDDWLTILLADVADKGLHAALFMAVTRTLFRREMQQARSPAAVALAVHHGLLDIAPNHDVFVTTLYGTLHQPTGRFTYVRAAQERPLLYRPGAGVRALPGDGRFLGMLPDLTLVEHSVTLLPGDRLLIFSDGVPDAVNPREEPFGYQRLNALLAEYGRLPAADLAHEIVNGVACWRQGAPAFDDLALLVTEVRAP